jgi:hypothetical protein
VRRLRGAAVLLREGRALPYDRYLPGEVMFWDIDDITESLSWDPNPRTLEYRLRSPDPCSGRPVPACWVIYKRALFLVNRDLTGFADMARSHGLTVIASCGGVLVLQEEGSDRQTVARLLDRDPPLNASPRWWLEQESEWISWHKAEERRRRDTSLWKESPLTGEQLAEVDALIADARAAGRWLNEYEVAARLGLGLYAVQRLLRQRMPRPLTDDEVADVVRRLALTRGGRVLPQDVVPFGAPRSRAVIAVRQYYGPDYSKLERDEQGRVTGPQVREAYGLCESTLSGRVRRGSLKVVGKAGRARLFDYEQVRAVLG